MCNYFHTVIKTTVPFDVNVIVVFVCNSEEFFGVIIILAGSVNLKLDAEIP